MFNMNRRYTVKLYPNDFACSQFERWHGACRFVWNLCLEQRLDCWKNKRYPSYRSQCRELTELKQAHEFEWLKDMLGQMLGPVIKSLDDASKLMFRKMSGRPRFKRKNMHSSNVLMHVPSVDDRAIRNGFLRIPKVGLRSQEDPWKAQVVQSEESGR